MKRLVKKSKIISANIELSEDEEESLRVWFGAGGHDFKGQQSETLDKILDRITPFEGGPLYRGIFANPDKFEIDESMYWGRKSSWTTNKSVALSFTDDAEEPEYNSQPILLIVKDAIGRYFYDINQIMNHFGEDEIISSKNASFGIEHKEFDNSLGAWVIELYEE